MSDIAERCKIVAGKMLKRIGWILFGDTQICQLVLFLPAASRGKIDYTVPEGYDLRLYDEKTDRDKYLQMMNSAGFNDWSPGTLTAAMHLCVPKGFFVLIHRDSDTIAATFMARHLSDDLHPCGGRVDWLAVHPAHRGKGLGFSVTAAATNRLIEIGYGNIYVTTDDDRLPAIKIFLKAGYVPDLYRPEMNQRWEQVCTLMGWKFAPEEWLRLKC
jgi:mycothiol synthase